MDFEIVDKGESPNTTTGGPVVVMFSNGIEKGKTWGEISVPAFFDRVYNQKLVRIPDSKRLAGGFELCECCRAKIIDSCIQSLPAEDGPLVA
jgi:hypothetical protein